jgi:hypothetical protein
MRLLTSAGWARAGESAFGGSVDGLASQSERIGGARELVSKSPRGFRFEVYLQATSVMVRT